MPSLISHLLPSSECGDFAFGVRETLLSQSQSSGFMESSYLNLQENHERYLTYGLAIANGRKFLGFGQYAFGSGHRGIFAAIDSHVGQIEQIIAGGEILVRGTHDKRISVIQANLTSGFVYNLQNLNISGVSNSFEELCLSLHQRRDIFEISRMMTDNIHPKNFSNHIDTSISSSLNLRHDLVDIVSMWNFTVGSSSIMDPEAAEILKDYIVSDNTRMALIKSLETLLDLFPLYFREFPSAPIRWKRLWNMTRQCVAVNLASTEAAQKFASDIQTNSHNSNHPNVLFILELNRFLRVLLQLSEKPDHNGYDLVEMED